MTEAERIEKDKPKLPLPLQSSIDVSSQPKYSQLARERDSLKAELERLQEQLTKEIERADEWRNLFINCKERLAKERDLMTTIIVVMKSNGLNTGYWKKYITAMSNSVNGKDVELENELKQKDITIDATGKTIKDLMTGIHKKNDELLAAQEQLKQKEDENRELVEILMKVEEWRSGKADYRPPYRGFPWVEISRLSAKLGKL